MVDEILSQDVNAASLAINWQIFGSNGQEKADYSRGVLERFVRRAPKNWTDGTGLAIDNSLTKVIADPRKIDLINNPHFVCLFKGYYPLDENGSRAGDGRNLLIPVEKIAINHYIIKSPEEYAKKFERGDAVRGRNTRHMALFKYLDRNDEFDDGILKYYAARAKVYQPPKPRAADDLIKALKRNLSTNSYAGKMETFLTCRAVSNYLGEKFFEEMALKAIVNAFESSLSPADKGLFDKELPELLKLPYPVVEDLRFMIKSAEWNYFQDALSNYPIIHYKDLLNF